MSSKGKKTAKSKKTAPKTELQDTDKLERDMQVIRIKDFDFSRLVYSEPKRDEIPGGGGFYRRTRLSYVYNNGKIGPPMVQLDKRYCFGVQPNNLDKDGNIQTDPDTGRPKPLTGYKVPIVMTSKEPTAEEQADVDFFDNLRAEIQRYAVENKKVLGKGTKSDEVVQDMVGEILFRKKDKKTDEILEDVSPKLYVPLLYFHKKKEMQTVFYGPGDEEIDNIVSMTGHFYIYPTIRIDSIFIGGKSIAIQLRLYDATVEPVARPPRKRLAPASTMPAVEHEEGEEGGEEGGEDDPNDMMESEED